MDNNILEFKNKDTKNKTIKDVIDENINRLRRNKLEAELSSNEKYYRSLYENASDDISRKRILNEFNNTKNEISNKHTNTSNLEWALEEFSPQSKAKAYNPPEIERMKMIEPPTNITESVKDSIEGLLPGALAYSLKPGVAGEGSDTLPTELQKEKDAFNRKRKVNRK